ncbi:uncharacterized protein LOC127850773 [Dreissena polymorpha]|uniref:Uncharacterized protein n=1 Tax=Dreissena polymorpha TaxID=45954 RepID=A0A9D4HW75_DREPO|nr:uncharacterized protein LOC127850773 [Dreissena polymorpha]XP_052240031.1 uncharacterized protein LOC127850773 [Dreissena polymorpha]KAH3735142.1 hypothetical protein DPMN_041603 [Dreissena polymorpha]
MKLLILLIALGCAECTLIEWTAADYFNPWTDPASCGRRPGRPSYVCDPNGVISVEAADFLDHILLNFQNATQCPCSTKNCEDRDHSKGYLMAIALVRKLKRPANVPDTGDATMQLAQRFTYDLLRKHWAWGTCDELTVIFYSKEDHILMTATGRTANRKLTDHVTTYIQRELARFFQPGGNVGQGLHYLTINYRHVLDNYDYAPVLYADAKVDSAATMVTISMTTSILTSLLLRYFC